MLSSRNEMIAVGVLILYIAFVPGFDIVRELLSSSIGKALALAGIIYVHKYVSCSVALLLVIVFARCGFSAWEGLTNGPCSNGYAWDETKKACVVSSSVTPPVPPMPPPPAPSTGGTVGASVNTPPPNSNVSTAPMTTPTASMPTGPANTGGGPTPSTGMSSTTGTV